ncbi:MAG: hypothetical protein ACXVEF_05195 [Polyangiales bacterium]
MAEASKPPPRAQAEFLPAFAASYPKDPELERLVAAFARGNHRAVREGAEALAKRSEDPEVVKAARDLRARLEPDKIAYVLLGATLLLLITLTAWAIHRTHEHEKIPIKPPPRTVQTISK